MASVTAGLISRETSLVSPTHSNQECRFKRLVRFLKKCGLEKDPFLTEFSRSHKNTIILAFALSIRCNGYGKTTKSNLLAGTIKSPIGDVAKTIMENFRRDPKRNTNNKIFSSIPTFIRGYK